MCGRFSLGVDTDRLVAVFGITESALDWTPRFNIAPTQDVAAVVAGASGPRLGPLRWGLVPHWADDAAMGSRLINARSETVDVKPAFRDPFRERRCLVLADGFYEWKRDNGSRTPMRVTLPDGEPFAFAGLWDRWRPRDGEPLHTCTIITTPAAPSIRSIHHRMPVILPAQERDRWIDPHAGSAALKALLRPYPGDLEAYPVSTRVNTPANDGPEIIEPVEDQGPA